MKDPIIGTSRYRYLKLVRVPVGRLERGLELEELDLVPMRDWVFHLLDVSLLLTMLGTRHWYCHIIRPTWECSTKV